ncbi:unnamed protein product [marine sediment metagenome]|uniref:Type 4 fimbrial biogenesis protein PilX N-terminal domain-containing protein n=1 Tax=marine sediment metagenome TaxID=412755 RepID=X0VXT6_9ZZZZ
MKKQAQMKIQQMAFMLIAIILFFALVAMFVIVFKFSGLKESAAVLEERNAMLLVTKLANSPEFACGGAFGTGKTNCVDADKVMILKENIGKYSNFWGASNIEIRKTYPVSEENVICTRSTYPDCNVIKLISDETVGTGVGNYVSLCRKESLEGSAYDKCEIAKLIVSYKIK